MWISIWRRPPFWILSNKKFDHKTCSRTSNCQSLCRMWCKSVQFWPSFRRLNDFKMDADAILDSGICEFLELVSPPGTPFCISIVSCQCSVCNNGPLTAEDVNFNMAPDAVLDFTGNQYCHWNQFVRDIKQQRSIFHHFKISNFTVTHWQ